MNEEEPEIQEPEIQEPKTIEEQLSTESAKPTKLNKNGKPRKQLSPEALERLAKAREKANAIRKQQQVKKLEDKVEKLNTETEPILGTKPEVIKKELKEKEVVKKELKEEPQQKELKEPEINEVASSGRKPRGKKKTKIIVEQSSEDSDEFEPNDNVVFVKRVSRKKKEPVKEPVKEPELEMELPPPEIPRPPRLPTTQELTPQQRILKSQYENMFSGGFMNNNLMRRHY
jgi:hypothetical protein